MKRFAFTGALLAAGAIGMLGLAPPPSAAPTESMFARGHGTMTFGDDHDSDDGGGRGYLRFSLRGGDTISGSLLWAGEHHHGMYPDIIIQMGNVQSAKFKGRSVKFSGSGRLHDDPVTVTVRAWDRGKGKADRFAIECVDTSGRIVFEADGHLFRGDIRVDDMGEEGRP
ncbi:MAG: hypothetical protein ACYTGP_11670 [Planctomycetota bacterium]|jgi:hypothetical protein